MHPIRQRVLDYVQNNPNNPFPGMHISLLPLSAHSDLQDAVAQGEVSIVERTNSDGKVNRYIVPTSDEEAQA